MAVPGQVVGLTATAHSTTSVRLQWDATADAVTYNVYYKIPSVGTYTQITLVGTITYDVTSLLSCQNYDFKVAAVNASGEGTHSDVVQGRPGCDWESEFLESASPSEDLVVGATNTAAWVEAVAVSEALDIMPAFVWLDSLAPTEHFAKRGSSAFSEACVDNVSPSESFAAQKYTLPYVEGDVLLVGR